MTSRNQSETQPYPGANPAPGINALQLKPSDAVFIEKVKTLILNNLVENKYKAIDLAKRLYLTESQLSRRLNYMVNTSTGSFIRAVRISHAAKLLLLKRMSIEDVAFEVGYRSAANFCRSFKQVYGCSPSKFVKQKMRRFEKC